ncbi:SRPBCC family protein [Nocardia asteroides]|uniref:SRPBCC family protein n=1 Tax=Nocardia asteroides TaxID=1824 RepID=UPI003446E7FF
MVVSRMVPAAADVLFGIIVEPAQWGRWFSIHREFVGRPPVVLTEGSSLVSRTVFAGVATEVEWTVEVLDAPYRMVLLGTGVNGLRSEFTYWLRPSESGTMLTVGGVFTGPFVTAPLSRTLESSGRDELHRTLEQLTDLATGIGSAPPAG